MDGWQVLSRLREAQRQTPVLLITALDAVHERVRGFELGPDDYLVKTGTGLGLAIVQGIASLHGGNMQITSKPGEGTRVTLRLPTSFQT